ncbi:citrate lyase acyl carrier protein [Thermanaerovibrio velox]|uniref:citrate lyase acyl carrier protein n=1 Tax=Thermanaerovibrio velox TaxID=108007 RepID=UPI001FDF9CB1|nr:citrate lyase acyl carrier protein [Thermanaerovibrio velox]
MLRLEVRESRAGTLESSDCLVSVYPSEGLEVVLKGVCARMYPERTRRMVEEALREAGIVAAVEVQDQGALMATMRARLRTAVRRAVSGGGCGEAR